MDLIFILAQIFGFAAFGAGVYAFLQTDEVRLAQFMGLQGAVLCVHFLLLGKYAGAFSALFSGTRTYLSTFGSMKKFSFLFIIAFVVMGYFSYQNWEDVFPVASGIFATYAFFHMHGVKKRLLLIFCTSLWIVHNIVVISIGPLMMETMFIVANVITIRKLLKRKQKIDSHKV